MKLTVRVGLLLALLLDLGVSAAVAQSSRAPARSAEDTVPVEVFQVLELPLAINGPVLVKTKGGYLLRCSLANSSEFRQLGLRYSLVVLDSSDSANRRVITLSEGFTLPPYESKNVTFKTPIRLKLNGDERLVLMLQQLISTDYVWDVINPREALAAYTAGDFSVTPRVLRVKNQIDAPIPLRIIF